MDSAELFQQRFTLLAEVSSDGICIHRDGRVVFANTAAVRWMGVDPAVGLVGRRVAEFVHRDSLPEVERRIHGVNREGGSAPPAEVVIGRPRRSARDVSVTSTRIEWDGYPAVVTNFQDLTNVKNAELLKYQAALLDHVSDAVIRISPSGLITSWNAAAETIYRRAAAQVLNRPVADAVGAPLDVNGVLGHGGAQHTTHFASDGSPLSVRMSAAATESGFVLVCADLTALRRAERHFETVVTALDVGVVVFRPDGSVATVNPMARNVIDGIALSGTSFASDVRLLDADGSRIPAEHHPFRQTLDSGLPQIDRIVGIDRTDGQRIWLSVSTRLLGPDHPGHSPVLCTLVDVTAQKLAGDQLRHDAHHDPLTGLPNRANALARMAAALASGAQQRLSAVLFIDVDTMKIVNDTYGHSAGDAVLTTIATRMGDTLCGGDVIARLAGDEFVVLLFERIDRPDIDMLVRALHGASSRPTRYRGADINVTASIGVTLVHADDARSASELLRTADGAMYAAKASGPGRTRYAP